VELQNEQIEKRSWISKLIRIFLWILLFAILLVGGLATLMLVYEKDVKAAILTELNRHLQVKVKVLPENIDLTLIKTFPDCALQFKNVLVLDALPEKNRDTLLWASELNLRFNAKDLWNKHYQIHSIEAKEGNLKLKVLKDGSVNYQFWKDTTSSGGSTDFDLDNIQLSKFRVLYKHNGSRFLANVFINELSFSGKFRSKSYDLACKGKMKVNELLQNKTSFLKSKNVNIDLLLAVRNNDYNFEKAAISINDLHLRLNGGLRYSDYLESLKLSFNGSDLQISSLLSLLPAKYSDLVNDYESEGKLYLNGQYDFHSEKNYRLDCDFGISNAVINYRPQSTTANDVNVDGKLHITAKESSLRLDNISLKLKDDKINGNCSIKNFSDPLINLQAQASMHLENLQSFWPIDTLKTLSGELQLLTTIEGRLADLKANAFANNVSLQLQTEVKNLSLGFKGDDKLYEVPHCNLRANNTEVSVQDLQLRRGKSDMNVSGTIPGLFAYLSDRQSALVIKGTLRSNEIHIEDFMSNTNSSGTSDSPLIPNGVNFSLDASIAKFTFGKFEASDLSGDIEIKNQKALANEVRLNTMEGAALVNAFLDNSKGILELTLQSEISNIEIKELFRQMNNFGQSTLQDQHLKGVASATIDFTGRWSNKLIVDEKSLNARCQLNIVKGELNNFEPLLILSRFVDVKELKAIRFANLQSDITIANRIITIPHTSIGNSALNIDVWGTHSFDNVMDYHIRLLISELLNKKRIKKQDEFGTMSEDPEKRRMAFIRMTGTVDKPVVKYDKDGLKQKISSDIKSEKQTVRRILKEELGLFKKDSLQKKPVPKAVFELEDESTPPPKKTLELKKKSEEEDF
jgi:hypothetical protein